MASSFDKPDKMVAVNQADLDAVSGAIADVAIRLHQMTGVTGNDFQNLVDIMDKIVERQHGMLRFAKSIADVVKA